MDAFVSRESNSFAEEQYEGFDPFMGKKWIYPNNMEVRPYQKTAVAIALFNNAMIVLPTGFGKTFIAAVVMYNFYRWYPEGKIVFVAPTRPLVAQQINECKKISGIPSVDCVELTGSTHADKRHAFWHSKRVFFATPQVIQNDLESQLIPARAIKCIVIDEAHRAQGSYAYVEIVKLLQHENKDGFRILALSATPGSNIERVKQVMINLFINEVMFRKEDAYDLIQFKNSKISKAWTVTLPPKHKKIVDMFIEISKPIFNELHKAGLTYSCDSILSASSYVLMQAQVRLRKNEVQNIGNRKGKLIQYCLAAISMNHVFNLLMVYGLRPFYANVKKSYDERKILKTAICGHPNTDIIMKNIEDMFGDDLNIEPYKVPTHDLTQGHPKLTVLKDILLKHFETKKDVVETRAMVFVKYRDSVMDIVQTLRVYEPVLKVCPFVGQSSAGLTSGMTQRDQIKTLGEFKSGVYNVLVATCVAEEGLDIGEVDLIICYDTSTSPISNTQRRGRTGRKRAGDVQTLVTKDYEEKRLTKAGSTKRTIEDQLYNRQTYMMCRYSHAPRMVPRGIVPECLEQKIYPQEEPEVEPKTPKSRKRKKTEVTVRNVGSGSKKSRKDKGACNDQDQWDDEEPLKEKQSCQDHEESRTEGARDMVDDEELWDDDDVISQMYRKSTPHKPTPQKPKPENQTSQEQISQQQTPQNQTYQEQKSLHQAPVNDNILSCVELEKPYPADPEPSTSQPQEDPEDEEWDEDFWNASTQMIS